MVHEDYVDLIHVGDFDPHCRQCSPGYVGAVDSDSAGDVLSVVEEEVDEGRGRVVAHFPRRPLRIVGDCKGGQLSIVVSVYPEDELRGRHRLAVVPVTGHIGTSGLCEWRQEERSKKEGDK